MGNRHLTPDDMTRYCANCKTAISSHVLVVNDKDFHRKSCYCSWAGHKVEGDRRSPKACRLCEPAQGGKEKKVQTKTPRSASTGLRTRAVMIVS